MSVRPALARAWTALDQGSGANFAESLAKWDRSSSRWKTATPSLLEDSAEFSGIWPKWGSMQSGVCWALAPLVPHTHGSECSYWPTPTATMAKSGWGHGRAAQGRYRPEVLKRCAEIGWSASSEMLEAVQGWPVGWTALDALETARFQEWQQQHGKSSVVQ